MMKRSTLPALGAFVLFGCGGGESDQPSPAPAPAPAPATEAAAAASGPMAVDWISVDDGARTVTIDLVAGSTDANNRWNFNGYANGEATIVVPVGYAVTVNFENRDPVNYHSFSVLQRATSYPAIFDDATPVFEGAVTSNATSMTEATAPGGGTESISFTASTAGEYALVCPVPAHAVTGMWIGFDVSDSGESGLQS
ncbi:MAG: multicopper oxidase domain-containing protein [Gemmatimonadales bacterium]|nr:multicopper oxidase domain-containing protein [Candidatus Palauibacter irciniicola]MYC17170.1 multicopper oxidase domain-containing protein [Gemmatimonadales bacterium]